MTPQGSRQPHSRACLPSELYLEVEVPPEVKIGAYLSSLTGRDCIQDAGGERERPRKSRDPYRTVLFKP